jgi:predicted permease
MDLITIFLELLSNLFWVYLFILLGIVWRFSRFYKKAYAGYFTKLTIWIFLPVLIISSFANIEVFVGEIIIQIGIIAFMVHLGSYFVVYLLTKKENFSPDAGSIAMTAMFPNVLLFPFPIILAVLGESALIYAAIFVFLAMVIRNTFGMVIGVRYSDEQSKESEIKGFNLKDLVKSMVKFPPFIAVIVGFILHSMIGPEAIGQIPGIDPISDISLYGSLLLVGVSFQDLGDLHPRKLFSKSTYQVSLVRFVVSPLIAIIPIVLFQLEPIIAITMLIQSMGPPAVSSIVYGTFFDMNESLMSSIITIVTLIALAVLPFELLLLLLLFPLT